MTFMVMVAPKGAVFGRAIRLVWHISGLCWLVKYTWTCAWFVFIVTVVGVVPVQVEIC